MGRVTSIIILDILEKNAPSVMKVSEIADAADCSMSSAHKNLMLLKKDDLVIRVSHGQWCFNDGSNSEEYKQRKIIKKNTIRYPVEQWSWEKGCVHLIRWARNRIKDDSKINITKEYLFDLWKKQEGKCALCDIPMTFIRGNGWQVPTNASLDKIDPSKGYIEGNVRLVCWQANSMKGQLTDEELIIFCKLIFYKSENSKHSKR